METWQSLILGLAGIGFIGDIILHFVLPSRRRKDNAESEHAQHDADKAEVERLHMQIDHQQKSLNIYIELEKKNAERIAEQNKSLDGKTEQIRNLTAQLIDSEHGRNADKDGIARLTAENADLKLLVEHYKVWHCQKSDCEQRIPPNKKLKGLKYEPPKRAVK